MKSKKLVSIIMGSASDKGVMKPAEETLRSFGIGFDVKVISAHRSPGALRDYLLKIEKMEIEVVIAGAGKAAHLPGVIASQTLLPVIGVPVPTKDLGGLDSLLSIVQMPSGVPVATVAIGGAKNAGLLAVQMLALKYPDLKNGLKEYKKNLAAGKRTFKK